jgi:hypothetical protein
MRRALSVLALLLLAQPGLAADLRPRPVDRTPPVLAVGNLVDGGAVHSGVLVGTARDVSGILSVEVSLDGGPFTAAAGTASWRFTFPTGLNTWKENSAHTIVVRATDRAGNAATRTLSVRKGNNRDVNGDGFTDVLVGGPTFGGNRGRVYLFYSSGPRGVPTDPVIDENNNSAGQHVIGGEFGAGPQLFGASVALADVNADGLADLIVGAPAAFNGAGRIYVFYPIRSANPDGVTLPGNATGTRTGIAGDAAHPGFGASVAAGDINGDGLADVVAGAVRDATQAGRAYAFLAEFNATNPDQSGLMAPTVFGAHTLIRAEGADDRLGQAVALGDVNGDGFADVVLGANGGPQGKAYVFLSTPYGLPASEMEGTVPAVGAGAADTRIVGENASRFGTAVAAGDVNGDGFQDVLVGGPALGGNRGRVYLFYSAGIKGVPTGPVIDENNNTAGQHVIGGEFGAGEQRFGAAVAIGEVSGDGLAELVVGAPASAAGAGRVYVFYPIRSANPDGVTLPGNATGTSTGIFGDAANPAFGTSVAIGDVNGDGFADVMGGAPQSATGRAYVFHSALNVRGERGINAPTVFSADTRISGEVGATFGASIAR